MKILHLSTSGSGGAYIAAERLVKAQISAGMDSQLLLRKDLSKNQQIMSKCLTLSQKKIQKKDME